MTLFPRDRWDPESLLSELDRRTPVSGAALGGADDSQGRSFFHLQDAGITASFHPEMINAAVARTTLADFFAHIRHCDNQVQDLMEDEVGDGADPELCLVAMASMEVGDGRVLVRYDPIGRVDVYWRFKFLRAEDGSWGLEEL